MSRVVVMLSLVLALSSGCAGRQITVSGDSARAGARELIFPYGVYRHRVRVTVPSAESRRQFDFDGVVRLQQDRILIIGLSHFGITAFRISEVRKTGEISSEVFIEAMKKHEPRLRELYSLVRILLTVPSKEGGSDVVWRKKDAEGRLLEAGLPAFGAEAVLRFERYDENGIPKAIQVESPKFSVEIEVAGYEI